MKRRVTAALILFFSLSFSLANHGLAHLKAPAYQNTEHWAVTLGTPIYDKEEEPMLKPQPGVFDTYSIEVKNTSSGVNNLTIQVFRINPNAEKIQLISQTIPQLFRHNQEYLVIKNVPIPSDDKELEVLLTWETKNNQTHKQSIVFNEADLGLFPE